MDEIERKTSYETNIVGSPGSSQEDNHVPQPSTLNLERNHKTRQSDATIGQTVTLQAFHGQGRIIDNSAVHPLSVKPVPRSREPENARIPEDVLAMTRQPVEKVGPHPQLLDTRNPQVPRLRNPSMARSQGDTIDRGRSGANVATTTPPNTIIPASRIPERKVSKRKTRTSNNTAGQERGFGNSGGKAQPLSLDNEAEPRLETPLGNRVEHISSDTSVLHQHSSSRVDDNMEPSDAPAIATGQSNKLDEAFERVQAHPSITFDHTTHTRPAVTHEHIKPHTHTIYEPQRTRSYHYHEHRTIIQPIKDPEPIILPEQHYAQDHVTGEIFRIPDVLGQQLDKIYERGDKGLVKGEDGGIISAMGRLELEDRFKNAEDHFTAQYSGEARIQEAITQAKPSMASRDFELGNSQGPILVKTGPTGHETEQASSLSMPPTYADPHTHPHTTPSPPPPSHSSFPTDRPATKTITDTNKGEEVLSNDQTILTAMRALANGDHGVHTEIMSSPSSSSSSSLRREGDGEGGVASARGGDK